MRVKQRTTKEPFGGGDPDQVWLTALGMPQELLCAAFTDRDKEHAESSGRKMPLKLTGGGIFLVAVEFLADGFPALGAQVDFEKIAERGRIISIGNVAVGSEREPVLIESVPDEGVLGDMHEDLIVRGIVTVRHGELDMGRVNENEMRQCSVGDPKGMLAASRNGRVLWLATQCLPGERAEVIKGGSSGQQG